MRGVVCCEGGPGRRGTSHREGGIRSQHAELQTRYRKPALVGDLFVHEGVESSSMAVRKEVVGSVASQGVP